MKPKIDYNLTSPSGVYSYAAVEVRGRVNARLERVILLDPQWAYEYARNIIGGRWPACERRMLTSRFGLVYARDVIQGPWPKLEPVLLKRRNIDEIYEYAMNCLKRRWLEAEEILATCADEAKHEIEKLRTNPHLAMDADRLRWWVDHVENVKAKYLKLFPNARPLWLAMGWITAL